MCDCRCHLILHFDANLIDLDVDSRSQNYKKAETSAPNILQSFQSMWIEFDLHLKLIAVMKLMLISSCPFSIQGGESYLSDFVKKTFNICFCLDIYRPNFFKLGLMIGTSALYILISVWMILTFIQGHNCARNQKLMCPIPQLIGKKFGMLP